jgi:hypothetical protein
VDEIIPVAPEPVSAEVAGGTVEAVRRGEATEPEAIGEESVAGPAHFMRSGNSFLGDYISCNDKLGPDPRTVNITVVTDHLCRIIEVEGPMIAKRAYDIYLRGCGIRRLGPELKSVMNRALSSAVHQGRVVSKNEPSGIIFSTVRMKGSPPVKVRCRGSRTFEEIPPGELRALGRYVCETLHLGSLKSPGGET